MKMNKVLAAMAASVVAASAFAAAAVSANAADSYPENYTVMLAGTLSGAELGWSNADAKDANSVKVDKNGTYTIKVDASKSGDQGSSTWAMAIRSTDFNIADYDDNEDFPTAASNAGISVKIDSVKINGEEKLNGTESKLIADDDGKNFRVNIYNQWGGNDYAIVDASQSFTGDVEVTFTVDGLKFGDQTAETSTTAEETTTTTGDTTTTTSGSTTTTTSGTSTAATTKAGEASAKTGDAGAAVAVAALGLAAATAFAVRKKD